VLDAGYCHTRAGFAGEDVPKSVLPSFYGSVNGRRFFGDECLIPRPDFETKNYMSRSESVVEDWDAATAIWEHMLIKRLQPDRPTPASKNGLNDPDGEGDVAMEDADNNITAPNPESEAAANPEAAADAAAAAAAEAEAAEKPLAENPLLMTEAPWNAGKAREKAIELAMESWGTPAFWLTRTPVAAAFAAGKASALVIDVGGANTSVTAVHDGMILKRSIQKSPVGGLWLSSQIRAMWDAQTDPRVEVVPTFMVENKTPVDAGAPAQAKLRKFPYDITPSFRAYEEERLLTEYKESVVEVWRGPGKYTNPGNEDLVRSQPGRIFEMPDGANQMWREQRYRVSEGMWDETAAFAPQGDAEALTKAQTIPELIRACLNNVDADLRPNLLGNVVVTGGTSLLNGFNDRLNNELTTMYPNMRIKIHAAGLTSERRFGSWIGGSILASLGTFHQMWISKKEYDENGVGIIEKRCK
jgi:actin-related protein 4